MSYLENALKREEVSIKSGLEDIVMSLLILVFSMLIMLTAYDFSEKVPFFWLGFFIFYGLVFYVLFFQKKFINDYVRSNAIQILNMRNRVWFYWLVIVMACSSLFLYFVFFYGHIEIEVFFLVIVLILNVYSFIQTKKVRFLGYNALFLVGFVLYWVMPALHPVLIWGFLFGLPCFVMIVNGFFIFTRFRKSLSDSTQPPAKV